eukprot:PhM_4_TR8668/c0_g1_i1/m.20243
MFTVEMRPHAPQLRSQKEEFDKVAARTMLACDGTGVPKCVVQSLSDTVANNNGGTNKILECEDMTIQSLIEANAHQGVLAPNGVTPSGAPAPRVISSYLLLRTPPTRSRSSAATRNLQRRVLCTALLDFALTVATFEGVDIVGNTEVLLHGDRGGMLTLFVVLILVPTVCIVASWFRFVHLFALLRSLLAMQALTLLLLPGNALGVLRQFIVFLEYISLDQLHAQLTFTTINPS